MKENFIQSLLGNTGANVASNVIFGKKKQEPQSTITASPAAVSPVSTTLTTPTNKIISPAKENFIKSQMAYSGNTPPKTGGTMELNLTNGNTITGSALTNTTQPKQLQPAGLEEYNASKPSPYKDAMNAYIQSLAQTPEEKTLRSDIAKRSVQSSIDYEKALQSGETMSFAQGEAGRIQRANQLGIGAQTGALEALTAGRAGDIEANKARVGYLASLEPSPKQQLELKKAQAELDKTIAENAQIGKEKPMTEYERAKLNQDYALKQRELALKEVTAAPASTTSDQAINQVNLIKTSLENAKKLADASGRSGIRKTVEGALVGGTDYTNLIAEANTLRTNILTLATDPTIKKFFGPQMSNADVQLMTSAGTSLNPELQSPEALKKELTRLEGVINKLSTVKGASTSSNIITAPDGTQIILTD